MLYARKHEQIAAEARLNWRIPGDEREEGKANLRRLGRTRWKRVSRTEKHQQPERRGVQTKNTETICSSLEGGAMQGPYQEILGKKGSKRVRAKRCRNDRRDRHPKEKR